LRDALFVIKPEIGYFVDVAPVRRGPSNNEREISRMRFLKTASLVALAVVASMTFAHGQTFLQDLDPGSLTEGVFGDIVYTSADPFEPAPTHVTPPARPDGGKVKPARRHGSANAVSR
jgi:hypothetical protein